VQAQTEYLQSPTLAATEGELEEVIVTGASAGPRLWRVSHNDHVLWILGVLSPLPEKLEWKSAEVSKVIEHTQAVLLDRASYSADANLFAQAGLFFRWRKLQKNPDGQELAQILPADLYARFSALSARYAKHGEFDDFRPMVAAGKLYQAAVAKIGLTERRAVSRAVEQQTKQRGIKPQSISIKVEQPREVLESINAMSSAESEIRCLAATLDHLESDIDQVRQSANAWAIGDVAALRSMVNLPSRIVCWDAINSIPRLKQLTARAEQEWMAAAEATLQKNQSSLALRRIDQLLITNGTLDQFRAKGYAVEGP
jgi:uncharacterized protein YbaP (TraB family)